MSYQRTIPNVAVLTGLEPATSTVTGWHSNQLSYSTMGLVKGLNLRVMRLLVACFTNLANQTLRIGGVCWA